MDWRMEAGRLLTLAFVIAALWWTGAALRRRTSDGVATLAVRMFALSATTWTVTGVWLDFKDLGSDPFDLRPLYRWSLRLGLVALATLVVLW